MSPRYEIMLTLLEAAWDTNRRCRDASNAILQLRQEESTVSELGVPLSTFLIFHSSYSHPSCAPRTARAVFSSRIREERKGEWYWEPSQSERAERRYLKHMQRVQLRSGRPLPPLVGKEGQKVSDNGGLRSAARNPTHDDLCDLGDDDGPPSPPPSPSSLPSFALTSFSFACCSLRRSLPSACIFPTGIREARILSTRMPGPEKYEILDSRVSR